MEITRNVILDLLPLYLANEVSEDTRILVNKYLEVDMELAELTKQQINKILVDDSPAPLTTDRELDIYLETKRLMFRRTVLIAGVVGFALLTIIILAILAAFILSLRL
jgi:hypothetical protein